MKFRIYILFLFNSLVYINIGIGQGNILTIAPGVSCKVPNNWSIAGQEAVDLMNQMKKNAGIETSSLKYILFSEDLIDETGYPLIQIGYEHLGFDGTDFVDFDTAVNQLKSDMQNKVIPTMELKLGEYFDKMSINSYTVDRSRKMVIYKFQTGIPSVGQVIGYNCLIYCKKGVARVGLNVQKDKEAQALPAFNIILKTFNY